MQIKVSLYHIYVMMSAVAAKSVSELASSLRNIASCPWSRKISPSQFISISAEVHEDITRYSRFKKNLPTTKLLAPFPTQHTTWPCLGQKHIGHPHYPPQSDPRRIGIMKHIVSNIANPPPWDSSPPPSWRFSLCLYSQPKNSFWNFAWNAKRRKNLGKYARSTIASFSRISKVLFRRPCK